MNFWKDFIEAVERKFEGFTDILDLGASEETIDNFSSDLELDLPSDFREIYQLANGQKDKSTAYFFGMAFLSIDEIKIAMSNEIKLIDELSGEDDMCSSFPEGYINCKYASRKWVPIFHAGNGGYVGIDLDPGEKGKAGQIINFGINDEDKFVLAESLEDFIKLCTGKLVVGKEIEFNKELRMYFYTNTTFRDALAKEVMAQNA